MTSCLQRDDVEARRPRILAAPPAYSSAAAEETIELAEMAGLDLDDWQRLALRAALTEDERGLWSAFEVALVVPRQNGKGNVLIARELAGLFLFGERLIIHSAHRFDTSLEAFRRLLACIESTPDLDRRVKRVSRSHGEEGIELRTGQRAHFRTRTSAGGRGFSGSPVILDEAMYLSEGTMSALMPTLSAQPNPQLWYAGSAVDAREHEHGATLTRVRNRGLAGDDPSLCYLEWSPDATMEQVEAGEVDLDDRQMWAGSNPARDRITAEHIARERRSMPRRAFAIERLGIGDWPDVSEAGPKVIDPKAWEALGKPDSGRLSPVAFGVTVSPDRKRTNIGMAGRRGDSRAQVEVVATQPGVDWAVGWLVERVARWDPCAVVLDGTALGLLTPLADAGIEATTTTSQDRAQATVDLFDAATGDRLRHTGDPDLAASVAGATKRPMGGRWVWDGPGVGQLQAVTLALYGLLAHGRPAQPPPSPQLASAGGGTRVSETADLDRAGF